MGIGSTLLTLRTASVHRTSALPSNVRRVGAGQCRRRLRPRSRIRWWSASPCVLAGDAPDSPLTSPTSLDRALGSRPWPSTSRCSASPRSPSPPPSRPIAPSPYAAATNDPNPRYTSGELAPPVFGVVPVFEAMGAGSASLIPSEYVFFIVHGEQDMHFHQPLAARPDPGHHASRCTRVRVGGSRHPGHHADRLGRRRRRAGAHPVLHDLRAHHERRRVRRARQARPRLPRRRPGQPGGRAVRRPRRRRPDLPLPRRLGRPDADPRRRGLRQERRPARASSPTASAPWP